MGSKKKKQKNSIFPTHTQPPQEEPDDDLIDDLLAQLDSKDQVVQSESAQILNEIQPAKLQQALNDVPRKQDSRSRYLARQARKAEDIAKNYNQSDPEADAQLEQEMQDEISTINKICEELRVEIHEINPDGHCLYAAIADQLHVLGILPTAQASYVTTRLAASNYIYTHPDDFLPFLPSVDGEDGVGATDEGFVTPAQFEAYCATIRDTGVWGGEPEILALCRAFNIPIHVIQTGNPPIVVHTPHGEPAANRNSNKKVVRISYHRRMYGLGEHYNSLRPKKSFVESLLS